MSLNRLILEETVSAASSMSHNNRAGHCNTSVADETEEMNRIVKCGSPVAESDHEDEEDEEEKHNPSSLESTFYTEEFVDLVDRHVSFNKTVKIVNFTTTVNETNKRCSNNNSSSTQSASHQTTGTKKPDPKKQRLSSPYVKRIRDGTSDFQRKLNRTIGLCYFCDERKSFTKLQWQKHLLIHTKENFYFCKQCGRTFTNRYNHTPCSPALMTNIYEKYDCVGENSLAAFVCNICDHVRVSESRMVYHLQTSHNSKKGQNYKKCNFVTNV